MTINQSQKTALITGGAGGLGRAIEQKFCQNNIKVALTDVVAPKVESSLFFQGDIRKGQDVDLLFHWTLENLGIPDILVLNAGVGIKESLIEGDPEKWQQVIDTNIMGALRCIRAFVPQMLKRKGRHVVFISSVAANQPHPYGGVYTASKTALDMIAETLRLETLPNLHITTVSPGATETSFFTNQLAGMSGVSENCPMMTAEDVAEDVFYAINKTGGSGINKIVTRPFGQQF